MSLRDGECTGERNSRAQMVKSVLFIRCRCGYRSDENVTDTYEALLLLICAVMALPINFVWNLQLALGQKIAVVARFASGFVCIIFTTLRVTQIAIKAGNEASPSPTWLAVWTIIEGSAVVCIGCGPAFAMSYCRAQRSTAPDSHGYIRHGPSATGKSRSRIESIKLASHMAASRARESRSEPYWAGSSGQNSLRP